jgi:hypothetical protein
MNVKNSKIGKSRNASLRNVKFKVSALRILSEKEFMTRRRNLLSPEDIHARLILAIGLSLATVFVITTVGITYALIFVTQPVVNQAPNDAAFIDVLKMIVTFLAGSLGGVLAGNGLKSKTKPIDTPTDTPKG